jgi:hypothetical protein
VLGPNVVERVERRHKPISANPKSKIIDNKPKTVQHGRPVTENVI